MPGPGVSVGGGLRVVTRGMGIGARFRGASGTPPPTVCREWAAAGGRPSSGPAGPPSPEGEGKGCRGGIHPSREWAVTEGRGGVGAPRPTDGDMETLWGLRGHPFPGRRAVGAGHARPGGLRRQASTVRSVGRGLDPSAGGCPGDGRWRKVSRGVGDAAPYGLPGDGRRREVAAGWGHPALRMGGYGNAVGFTWAPVSGPPRGRGRACPARGFA